MVDIIPIPLGLTTCYVLKAEGVIAVDASAPNQVSKFLAGLMRASLRPEDVQLIVLTHGHWDHIGSARDLQSATGAKLAIHEREVAWMEQALTPHPPGVTRWGRFLAAVGKSIAPLIKYPPAKVDVPLDSAGLSLAEFGIPGRVLHTPGHTAGSVSILLDTGEAFVGDLAMNAFPLRLSPGLPVLAEDADAVVASWELLLEAGTIEVFPAHGKPFSADVIRRAIAAG